MKHIGYSNPLNLSCLSWICPVNPGFKWWACDHHDDLQHCELYDLIMEMYIGIDIQVKISSQLAYNHAFTAILWPKIENSGLF